MAVWKWRHPVTAICMMALRGITVRYRRRAAVQKAVDKTTIAIMSVCYVPFAINKKSTCNLDIALELKVRSQQDDGVTQIDRNNLCHTAGE